jgi:hypothetical protein
MSQNKTKHSAKRNSAQNRKRLASLLKNVGGGLAAITLFILVAIVVVKFTSTRKVPVEAAGGPRLRVFQEQFDLGTLKLGQTVPVKIEIANVGDQILRFTNAPYLQVVKGCCPPTPEIGSMQLKPGETTTVTFFLMMHGSMGGYHDLRLHLETNDPKQADRTITILSDWVP